MTRLNSIIHLAISVTLLLLLSGHVLAMPDFARKYNMSCAACHAAYPKLNQFGEHFAGNNFKLDNWESGTLDTGDKRLKIPEYPPLAVRAQGYFQAREAGNIDPISGKQTQADTDFQSPYLIKLLSSAPLSEHITYYFYAIFGEKGGNGEVIVEDAWFRHDDIFGSGVGMQLGQFQVSDLMFPRETRLSFQDFMAYRMAGITYERGVLFDRAVGPLDIGLGFVNGNGISDHFDINSPGFNRADNLFDNDNSKTVFGRVGFDLGPVSVGLFGLDGTQRGARGPAGLETSDRDTDKRVAGLDLSGSVGGRWYWYTQYLWNEWDGFLETAPEQDFSWDGGFAGVDYIPNDRWAFSALYNYADAGDFDNSDTIYEGIDINSVTLTASYYFMRNLKGIMELNVDLLDDEPRSGDYYTGHLEQEHYFLLGFDAAY
ncbi:MULTISPECIES: outer membrane protein [unclassified Wenzhouxiangella]|uniref:outer membrane protein n=1 Tax=unclassified Wenzhouxiangella TaxID=2613841 RepID=UPI001C6F33C5|nr:MULTISPECIES: hypothetical protein [unclassified Wenzhouxiangella]